MKHKITVKPDGTIEWSGEDILSLPVEKVRTRRASHIRPCNPAKRWFFILLRFLFGDRGSVAAWTRTWDGPWEAILLHDNRTYAHLKREACLQWERERLNE